MNPLGAGLLALAAVGGVVLAIRPTSRTAATFIVVGWWSSVFLLGQRFVALDLSLREVVSYSRAELSAPLRAAGLWAGPSGSLLLWCAVMVTAGLAGLRVVGASRGGVAESVGLRVLGIADAVAVVVLVGAANPFVHDVTTPVNGIGLSPVLEHRAMIVHPPLLYTAHAATFFCAMLLWYRPQVRGRQAAIGAALALLVVATLIGAWWAHDELGWGGWWAWDPVENTALGPLAALIAALHSTSRAAARRWAMFAAALVFAGVASARSGLASSVHAFAPSPGPSIAIGAAGVALALMAVWPPWVEPGDGEGVSPRWRNVVAILLSISAGWVALVVVSAEVGAAWLGSRDPAGTLDTTMVARLLAPVGIAVVAGLALWGWRIRRVAVVLAHVGVVVFSIGVIASMADWQVSDVIELGSSTTMHGATVNVGEREAGEDRVDVARVEVPIEVDGTMFRPSILRYRDLQRTRSRPDRTLDWRGETEVVITYVDATRARIQLRRHPGLGQVWVGGALVVLGCGSLGLRRASAAITLALRRQQRVD